MSSDRILDAARAVFEQYGARRANVDDIAAEAGVSRSTLYRRYATKDELLAAMVMRETDAFLDELDAVAADLPPQEAVIECFTRGLRIMRDIPVLGRLAKSEPEAVTAIAGGEHVLLAQSDRIAATLRRAGATMPDDELALAAETLLRVASTYLMSPGGHLDLRDEYAVRDYAKRYLSPLVN